MSKKPHNVCIATKFQHENQEKTRFTKVGVAWLNERKNGEPFFQIELDFPVGATSLLIFPPSQPIEDE